MTLEDWDKDIAAMTDKEIADRRAALATLKAWPRGFAEFKWTGLWVLDITMDYEQQKRERSTEKK